MSDNPTFDQRERWNDLEEAARIATESALTDVWTAVPGIVTAHDRDKNTIKVKSALKLQHVKADGSTEWLEIPEMADVPLQYPGGGGATWTFPIKQDDEVLLVFASRNMDKWHQQGGVQEQNVPFRMHDMSDGFAIPGFRSSPRKLSNISANTAQLRTDNGQMVIDFDPIEKKITIKSPDNPVRIEADLHVTGEVKAKCDGGFVQLSTHRHTQPDDSDGDAEQPTNQPMANT